ncbi:CPBP family intramembrane glutamic endopeptidase [Venenivibrio stagnispumantis]
MLSALYLPFLNFSVFPTNQVVQILAEEIFFRGYIQNELLKIYNPFKSIVLSSILFMVAHLILNPSIFSGLTIFPSIIFGYLYFYSKSVISSFIFHLFSNWFFLSQFSN